MCTAQQKATHIQLWSARQTHRAESIFTFGLSQHHHDRSFSRAVLWW